MSYNYLKKYRKFDKIGFDQASDIIKKKGESEKSRHFFVEL